MTVYLATFCFIYILTILSPVHYSHPVTIMRLHFWRHATVHTDSLHQVLVHYSHSVTKCDCISGDMLLYIQIYYTRSSPLFTSSDNNAAMFLATRYCISIILIFRPSFTSSDNNVTVYLATFCCIYIFTMLSPVHYSHPVTIMRPYFWRHATVHTDLISLVHYSHPVT